MKQATMKKTYGKTSAFSNIVGSRKQCTADVFSDSTLSSTNGSFTECQVTRQEPRMATNR